jgi:hypothetical protein
VLEVTIMTRPRTTATEPLAVAELNLIERRMSAVGLFTAHAYTDMGRLIAEVRRLRHARAIETAEHAELLAAARAALAAETDREADPLGYLRDLLTAHGQLPAPGQNPAQLLARPDHGWAA